MATQLEGAAVAQLPTANGTLWIITPFFGAVTAPMPTAGGEGGLSYDGAVVAPLSVAVADLLMGWAGDGAVTAPFSKVTSTMLPGWVGAAVASMPTINALLSGSIPIMAGEVTVAAFPKAFGILSREEAEAFTVMVMNLKNRLVSFYQNYNFNSACPFNGVYIAAGSDGIYLLSGTDDNGVGIDASILLGDMNFGTDYIKTNPQLFINYSGTGPLQVSIIRDQNQDVVDGPYEVPGPRGTKLETNRAKIPQGLRGVYYQSLIENVNGSTVNIQNIRMKFLKSQRTIH